MNKPATKELITKKHINMRSWSRGHGFSYPCVTHLLNSHGNLQETRKQRKIIDALIEDGLYVPSSEDQPQ